ncbi:cytochrome P450 [Rhizoctonia solani]|uniref:Cytochrome P450 n=1 Tax=Rhizoctonia solani TaxID=456999 RepID=A0A8H7HI06_9AGAM|nr:cytochrome P450 [Rhizoctonia solani]
MPWDMAQSPFSLSGHLSLVAFTLAVTSWMLYAVPRRSRRLPLPPGPNPDPLIGHLRTMPVSDSYLVYARWAKELKSDVVSITVLGKTTVILSSVRAANELLDQRSAIYSNRPDLPMVTYPDLVDWSRETTNLQYGERWRSQRRMTHRVLHKAASTQLWPIVTRESRLALQRISTNPKNFLQEIRRMTGSTLLAIVYGYEVTSANDPLVRIVEAAAEHFSECAVAGNFLVNTMPWLRHIPDWFPGTEWKQTVKEWRKDRDDMIDTPFNWTKQQIASGVAENSITRTWLANLENNSNLGLHYEEEEDRIKWAAGTLFAAGADTHRGNKSSVVLSVFILAMTLHQDVLSKVQAEIDEVTGKSRLPEMRDREGLPYLECVLREVLRWQPTTPMGVAHACAEDDEYQGYSIPKGATVISNIWAMCYDDLVYPEPERFNPDRFLDPQVPKPPAFGFGRRSCPGVHMAESTLFITMATLLALFDIRPVRDQEGNEVLPQINMRSNALVSYPADFECSITPRSENAMRLLNASVTEA